MVSLEVQLRWDSLALASLRLDEKCGEIMVLLAENDLLSSETVNGSIVALAVLEAVL